MKHFMKILLIIFFANNVFSQSGWIQQNSGITSTITSVKFINSNTGICVGNSGKILRTTNGGTNWILQSTGYQFDLTSLAFSSAFAAYIVGDSGLILKSTNGGSTWFGLSLIQPYNFASVFFINDNLGYVGGDRMDFKSENKIFKTLNGGITWDSIEKENSSFVKSLFFVNSNKGWSTKGYDVLNSEGIYKTTDASLSWLLQFDRSPPISSVFFIDTLSGWVGARAAFSVHSILRTTDGGTNWTGPFLFIQTNSIFFINKYKGWSASNSTTIFATSNGGEDWINQTLEQPGVNYNSVYFTDSLTGWVVGDSGTILKTTTGGILTNYSNPSTEVPDKYFLFQNYPNPFNPSTNINFSIPKSSFVALKVFDMAGKEIASLVNENLNAGVYSFDFNAEDLASGIYFYKLTSLEFSEVKRMTLLK